MEATPERRRQRSGGGECAPFRGSEARRLRRWPSWVRRSLKLCAELVFEFNTNSTHSTVPYSSSSEDEQTSGEQSSNVLRLCRFQYLQSDWLLRAWLTLPHILIIIVGVLASVERSVRLSLDRRPRRSTSL